MSLEEFNKRQDEINEFKSHVLYKMDSEEHVVDRNNKLDLSPVPQYQSNHHHHQSYEVSSTNEDSPLNIVDTLEPPRFV